LTHTCVPKLTPSNRALPAGVLTTLYVSGETDLAVALADPAVPGDTPAGLSSCDLATRDAGLIALDARCAAAAAALSSGFIAGNSSTSFILFCCCGVCGVDDD
jgi:hypothetical protein